jgi:predicted outer membrane lipoprotein
MKALWMERVPSKDERKEIFDDIRALWMERMEERMAKRLEAQLEVRL